MAGVQCSLDFAVKIAAATGNGVKPGIWGAAA